MANKDIILSASYDICAAHRLFNPDWDEAKNRSVFGKCADLHGHQYKMEVVLTGPIHPETGMLINGYDVDAIITEKVFKQIDHKCINEDIPFFKTHQATAEWIAVWAFDELKDAFPQPVRLKKIRMYETPNLFAEYEG